MENGLGRIKNLCFSYLFQELSNGHEHDLENANPHGLFLSLQTYVDLALKVPGDLVSLGKGLNDQS